MSASLQSFIALMLAGVAFDFFAIAADAYGVGPSHGCSSPSLLGCS
jgi:hypothetical protein